MAASLMMFEQQFLPKGEALRLSAANEDRELVVAAGRVWLTRSRHEADPWPGDCWLLPGDRLTLRAGDDAVVEGWPSASFRLRPAPQREAA
jgi:hypothetical protein